MNPFEEWDESESQKSDRAGKRRWLENPFSEEGYLTANESTPPDGNTVQGGSLKRNRSKKPPNHLHQNPFLSDDESDDQNETERNAANPTEMVGQNPFLDDEVQKLEQPVASPQNPFEDEDDDDSLPNDVPKSKSPPTDEPRQPAVENVAVDKTKKQNSNFENKLPTINMESSTKKGDTVSTIHTSKNLDSKVKEVKKTHCLSMVLLEKIASYFDKCIIDSSIQFVQFESNSNSI